MFAPAHMAVGALCQAGVRRKLPTAVVAFASTAIVDSTNLWHAPYPWPSDSPVILRFIPYPHDVPSIMTLVALVVATILVGFLLRRYWWGMVWAVAPDIIDWLILRPTLGRGVIHEWLSWISTPWGFALEMAFVALIVVVLLKRQGKMAKESLNNS